jgi:hypothetical protein
LPSLTLYWSEHFRAFVFFFFYYFLWTLSLEIFVIHRWNWILICLFAFV